MPDLPKLAWLGTGIMGAPMAGHLLDAGYPLAVYNRTAAKANDLVRRGARRAASPAEAAREVDVILMCLGDTPDVESVLFGDTGVCHGVRKGAVVVDHSTVSPTATIDFAARLRCGFVDAPVSGGDVGARNGTLSIMCGGSESDLARVRPVLDCYGKTVTHCGPVGKGQLTKLINQVLVSVTNLAVAEAVTLAEAANLDPEMTLRAVGGGAAGSWQLQNLGPKMFAGDHAPGFTVDMQQKDLRLVLEYARERRLPLLGVGLVSQLFAAVQARGGGGEGTQALVTALRSLRGDA